MVNRLVTETVVFDYKHREDVGMTPLYAFTVPSEEMTQEEIEELKKAEIVKKLETLKKAKKKPRSEEEEAKEFDELKSKIIS